MDTSKISTSWRGLEPFAHWLVDLVDPKVTVELGCEYGFSLIELARYSRGETIGIDHFGDGNGGFRDTREHAKRNIAESGFEIQLIESSFEDALSEFDPHSIDILHIDGDHDYQSVKRDFETWLPKVRSGGVIIMHDTESFPNGVGRFFNEIPFRKFKLTHSHGLGVVTV
jgi:predicted O-methyltransferase YrrM